MTDKPMTLREKVLCEIVRAVENGGGIKATESLDAIAYILEDTGSPAHMRVAKELRGG